MRRFLSISCLLALLATGLTTGCGGGSGIEEGMPADTAPPPDFDPGGDAKPDMSGQTRHQEALTSPTRGIVRSPRSSTPLVARDLVSAGAEDIRRHEASCLRTLDRTPGSPNGRRIARCLF